MPHPTSISRCCGSRRVTDSPRRSRSTRAWGGIGSPSLPTERLSLPAGSDSVRWSLDGTSESALRTPGKMPTGDLVQRHLVDVFEGIDDEVGKSEGGVGSLARLGYRDARH